MQTLTFRNGDALPAIGLGTWKSQPGDVHRAVLAALRMGYRHIDCARIYQNEREVGLALTEAFREGVVDRRDVWVTSKLWNDAHAPADVRPALEQTLADLGLEDLDLYLVHWPVAHRPGVLGPQSASDFVPLEELPLSVTWQAMEQLAESGLVRHIGVSNFSAPKLRALCAGARRRPEMNQVELHPYLQQDELLATCRELGVHVTAYSPLGSPDRPEGMKAKGEPVLLQDPVVGEVAARHGASPAQVLVAWAVARGTAVIPKSVHPDRMRQNLEAARIELTDEDMGALAGLDRHRRYVDGTFWERPGGPYTVRSLWDE